jgi:hypothetical protein
MSSTFLQTCRLYRNIGQEYTRTIIMEPIQYSILTPIFYNHESLTLWDHAKFLITLLICRASETSLFPCRNQGIGYSEVRVIECAVLRRVQTWRTLCLRYRRHIFYLKCSMYGTFPLPTQYSLRRCTGIFPSSCISIKYFKPLSPLVNQYFSQLKLYTV